MPSFLFGKLASFDKPVQAPDGDWHLIPQNVARDCLDFKRPIQALVNHRCDLKVGWASTWATSAGLFWSMPVASAESRQALQAVRAGSLRGCSPKLDITGRLEILNGLNVLVAQSVSILEGSFCEVPGDSSTWVVESVSDLCPPTECRNALFPHRWNMMQAWRKSQGR
jgi:phage head maturation protease